MQFQKDWPKEFGFLQHFGVFLLACFVLVLRRPDAILHAQFWAEDGHVWFSDAYNLGWCATLFRTQDGYFQTLPRLAAALALLVPMALAPLILNLVAVLIQAIPVNLLLSSRSSAWGSLRYRSLMAVIYLALPNSREMGAIVTSSQWVLALSAFLLLVSVAPKNSHGLLDISILMLCGLTGPFCFFLLPVGFFLAWERGGRWQWGVTGLLVSLCLVQAWGLLVVNPSGRAHAVLGACPGLFIRILAGQIYLGATIGGNNLAANPSGHLFVFLLCIAIGGTSLITICFFMSGQEMKLFLLFSFMLLAASLISPAAYPPPGITRWQLLAQVSGIRYWFFPTLAAGWSILYVFTVQKGIIRLAAGYLLFFMCVAIIRDWRHPDFKDMHFAQESKLIEAAPAGTVVTLKQNPEGWTMQLVKRGSFK